MSRIAMVCADPGVPVGGTKGASVHLGEIARALSDEGAEVLLVAATVEHEMPGVRVETLPGPPRRSSIEERLAAEDMREQWLTSRLADWDADVVYERVALHTRAASRAALRLSVPYLIELNSPLLEEQAAYRKLDRPEVARTLWTDVLAAADVALVVSRPLATYAKTRGARRVTVVPNAADPNRFATTRDATLDETPLAVLSGRLRPWHGAGTVAEAWRLLGPDAPRLLVVGDGDGRDELEAVGANVTGFVPHAAVPELLSRGSIGLVPYSADAPDYFSPIKLFEYLAAGLAVIAADIPGVRDITGSTAAHLVARGDVDGLATAVASLASDGARRSQLGREGRALVARAHSWQHRARRVRELVEEMRSRHSSAVGG